MKSERTKIWLSIISFVSIFVLTILPDIYLYHAHNELTGFWLLQSVLSAALLGAFVYFSPWKWLKILLLTIIMFVSMLEISTVFTYYNFFNSISFPAFVYANTSEMDDMTYYISHFTLKHEILPLLLYVCAVFLIFISSTSVKRNIRYIIFGSCTVILCLMLALGGDFTYKHAPYHIFREAVTAVKQGKIRDQYLPRRESFTYNAKNLTAISRNNKIFVLGIGESMNHAHCSFNNQYHRHTTPHLEKIENTLFYTNYYTSATYTEQAVPMLLTRATANNFNSNYEELPLQTVFKETGYKTYVISHQSQIMNNGVDGYLAEGADSVIFVNSDREIVHTLEGLTEEQENVFALLHFSGSHFFYNNYPCHYNKWRPNYNHDKEIKSDSLFINAYDNSLLYTDSLLYACVEALKKSGKEASFVFTSDHGEYLDSHIGGHGLSCKPTKEEYHVPLMVWYSEEYKEAYPEKVANLIKHKDEPVCADHVFWSVLDMANIQIDSTLQQEGMSILGDTLLPHRRTLLLPDGRSILTLD